MAKKTATKTKESPPAKPSPAKAARTYDISSLSAQLGAADQAFAERTFRRVREEALVSEGTRTDSQNILDDIPRFVGSSIEILEGLSQKQRDLVKLPPALLPLLVHEAVKLRKDKANHDAGRSEAAGEKAERESASRVEVRSGISVRDLCYDALRNALGDDCKPQIDEIAGTADTPENLALGLEALARFLDKVREGEPDDALSLADYGLDAAYAESLRRKAAKVRDTAKVTAAPGRKVTQGALDLQDGRVLYLIEKVIRSFRAARRADPIILVPELNKIAWMFETRSGKAKGAETPAAAPTEGQPT